jgi:hypothetical protein
MSLLCLFFPEPLYLPPSSCWQDAWFSYTHVNATFLAGNYCAAGIPLSRIDFRETRAEKGGENKTGRGFTQSRKGRKVKELPAVSILT